MFLLDANVLIALAWPSHVSHALVQRWFGRNAASGWATCPLTEAAFVRIISNPAFSLHALAPLEAVGLLRVNVGHPAHRFWPDNLTIHDAVKSLRGRLIGHQQVTDAYLLGLAVHHKARLASLDQGIVALAGHDGGGVEIIR